MNSPTDIDLIERYLLGKMTDADIRSFEARLGNDRELARKFRLITTFPEMMSDTGRLEYEKKLVEAAEPVVKKKPFRVQRRRYFIWAAVSFTVIIAIALLLIFKESDQQKTNIVREENVVRKENIVKDTAAPVKDTPAVTPQLRPVKKEIREVAGNKGQKAIELLTPADGMKFSRKEVIMFNWTQKTDSFTRFYIISIPHDQVLYWRCVRPGIREYKVPGSYLFPGVYYWYVGRKEDKRTFIISE